jgi:hypothetical protein
MNEPNNTRNGSTRSVRAAWEGPRLRQMAVNLAEGGNKPGNDGSGVGTGSANHS